MNADNAASPSIFDLLTSSHIVIDAAATARAELFAEIGALFAREGLSARNIIDALDAREALGSTALGQGVAIPHGRIKNLDHALAACIRTRQPIDFDAPDQKPVNLFFVLLVPSHATEHHLQLLAELAQVVGDREFRDALMQAPDESAVHALLQGRRPAARSAE